MWLEASICKSKVLCLTKQKFESTILRVGKKVIENEDNFDKDSKRRVKRPFQFVRSFPIDVYLITTIFELKSGGRSTNLCSLFFALKNFFRGT